MMKVFYILPNFYVLQQYKFMYVIIYYLIINYNIIINSFINDVYTSGFLYDVIQY